MNVMSCEETCLRYGLLAQYEIEVMLVWRGELEHIGSMCVLVVPCSPYNFLGLN